MYWYNTGLNTIFFLHIQLKAYAKEQGVPSPNSNLKGFVSDLGTLPRDRGIGPSFQTLIDFSNILINSFVNVVACT